MRKLAPRCGGVLLCWMDCKRSCQWQLLLRLRQMVKNKWNQNALHADKVVAITDCLVPFPNFPAHISMTRVDYVVEVDAIGDPGKIATGAAKPTTDQRKLMMADYCTKFVVNSPYFKDGFSYQTGVGGASIASTISLAKEMKERNVRMRFGVGGLTKPMCDLLINDQVDCLLDTQDFDLSAVESVKNLKHFRISAGQYADPFNKGAIMDVVREVKAFEFEE